MTSKLTQTVRKARGILDESLSADSATAGSRFNARMAFGFVGIYSFELHFPESHSLKEKRMHLRSVKAQLANRVACSIAEVDHHDDVAARSPDARVRRAGGAARPSGCSTRPSAGSWRRTSSCSAASASLVTLDDSRASAVSPRPGRRGCGASTRRSRRSSRRRSRR